jgi:hypothetical protein
VQLRPVSSSTRETSQCRERWPQRIFSAAYIYLDVDVDANLAARFEDVADDDSACSGSARHLGRKVPIDGLCVRGPDLVQDLFSDHEHEVQPAHKKLMQAVLAVHIVRSGKRHDVVKRVASG